MPILHTRKTSLFIAVINDETSYIRKLGWKRILKARRSNSNGILQFKITHLSFASKDYVSIIDFRENDITEPPLCKKFTDTEIENNIKLKIPICLPALVCHKQAVERTVKLVTDDSQKVIMGKKINGYIHALLIFRSKLPKFTAKKDYVL